MSFEMHFENGWVIQPGGSRAKWKIKTTPGRAMFFRALKDARKWAKANAPESPVSGMDVVREFSTPSAGPMGGPGASPAMGSQP